MASSTTGILLVDKPAGITSHDVVARSRRLLNTRKIGHAGTLDPMATGLMLLGVGSSTRLLTWIVGLDKTYEATIRLGASSGTDDAEGELSAVAPAATVAAITEDDVLSGIAPLTGAILQRPSAVSAIKVDGQRAYARVRAGEDVQLKERPVTVHAFDVLGSDLVVGPDATWLDVRVRVSCSSGTYIRALARDLGDHLGVGGHLTALRRTSIGPWSVDEAGVLDESLEAGLRDAASIAGALFEVVHLDAQESIDLGHGKRVPVSTDNREPVAAVDPSGRLLGLVEVRGGRARVLVNFPTEGATA